MDKKIDMLPVESSNVKSVGYDADSQTLAIEFKSGGVYHYEDVPKQTFADLMAAESPGKYVRSKIVGSFKHEKMEPEGKESKNE